MNGQNLLERQNRTTSFLARGTHPDHPTPYADVIPTPQLFFLGKCVMSWSEHHVALLVAWNLEVVNIPAFGPYGYFNIFQCFWSHSSATYDSSLSLQGYRNKEFKGLAAVTWFFKTPPQRWHPQISTNELCTNMPRAGEPNWWEGGNCYSHEEKMLDPHARCMHFFKTIV